MEVSFVLRFFVDHDSPLHICENLISRADKNGHTAKKRRATQESRTTHEKEKSEMSHPEAPKLGPSEDKISTRGRSWLPQDRRRTVTYIQISTCLQSLPCQSFTLRLTRNSFFDGFLSLSYLLGSCTLTGLRHVLPRLTRFSPSLSEKNSDWTP